MPIDLNLYTSKKKKIDSNNESIGNSVLETPNKNNGYQFGKLTGTLFDFTGDVATGVGKGIEGIVDWGVLGLIGIAGEIFGNEDLTHAMEKAAKYDVAGNTLGQLDNKMSQNSFLNNDSKAANIVHQVGSGIGMMLPSVVVSAIATPAAGMAVFGAGAAGAAQEEALNDGANIGQAFTYGTASGIKEVGIEYLSGLIGGTNVITNAGKIFKGSVGSAAKTFIEEGTEEVVGDIADAQLKRLIYDSDATSPQFEELFNSFLVGGLTAMALGGAEKSVNLSKYGVNGTKIENILSEQSESDLKEYKLEKDGEITIEQKSQFAKERAIRRQQIGDILLKMQEKAKQENWKGKRAETIYDRTTTNFHNALENINQVNPVSLNIVEEVVAKANKQNDTNIEIRPINQTNINSINQSVKDALIKDEVINVNGDKTSISDGLDAFLGSDGVVYINTDSKVFEGNLEMYKKVTHEISHKMSEFDIAQLKKSIYDGVLNGDSYTKYAKKDGVYQIVNIDKDNMYKYYKNLYNSELKNLTKKQQLAYIQEEVMADYLGSKIQDSTDFSSLMNGSNETINNAFKALMSSNTILDSIKERNNGSSLLNDVKYSKSKMPYSQYNSEALKWANKSSTTESDALILYNPQTKMFDVIVKGSENDYIVEQSFKGGDPKLKYWRDKQNVNGGNESVYRYTGVFKTNFGADSSISDRVYRNKGAETDVYRGNREESIYERARNNTNSKEDNKGNKYSLSDSTYENKTIDEKLDIVRDKTEQLKTKTDESIVEKVKNSADALAEAITNGGNIIQQLQIQLTNSFAGVENAIKKSISNTDEAKSKINEIRSQLGRIQRVNSISQAYIEENLYKGIYKNIPENQWHDFEVLLQLRKHIKTAQVEAKANAKIAELEEKLKEGKINSDEYEREKAKNIEEKNYIDEEGKVYEGLSASDAQKMVDKILSEHPEFNEYADKVYSYLDGLMDRRLTTGVVNKQQVKFMKDYYSENGVNWYVPTGRIDRISEGVLGGNNSIGVKRGIHRMTGSGGNVISTFNAIAEQTTQVYRQQALNDLFNLVYDATPDSFVEDTSQRKESTREDNEGKIEPKKDEVYFYKNGERIVYKVDSSIAIAFDDLRNRKSNFELVLDKTTGKMVSTLKKLTTEFNPFFAIRNLFRDASDAFIYTKYNPNLLRRYKRSLTSIKNNDLYYEAYKRNGGEDFSFFQKDGTIDLRENNHSILNKISEINGVVELMPRLSEFQEGIDSRIKEYNESNNTNVILEEVLTDETGKYQKMIDASMLDAAEVTVNFGKHGTFTKKMNRYFMPYLNAQVQGFCKTWNTFVHPESIRAWGMSVAKMVMMSLPTLLFNEIWFRDDDDYQELSDDIKGSYFLIKVGNNRFLRIPRGRVETILGDAMQRTYRSINGEEDAFAGYLNNLKSNMTPIDNMSRSILSPITDVSTNTTWYGGNIENSSMQKLPVSERYDENTSEIAKWISNVTGNKMSPKKWNYLLDQYSGVLGDVVLPLTTKSTTASGYVAGLTGLSADSLKNNKYTSKYYDKLEELTQNKNSSNATGVDKAKYRYANSMKNKINQLYTELDNLKDEEQKMATKELIVYMQKTTLDNIETFGKILEKYEYGLSIDELYDEYYREATRECFGAEITLKDYNSKVYEKATAFNKLGIDWETFYNIYFDAKDFEADYDINGNVISGSRKAKVTKYVKSLKLNATQKYMVMGLLGYKNANGKAQVRSALIRAGYTGYALKEMLELCGYDD